MVVSIGGVVTLSANDAACVIGAVVADIKSTGGDLSRRHRFVRRSSRYQYQSHTVSLITGEHCYSYDQPAEV